MLSGSISTFFLAQSAAHSGFSISPPWVWFLVGLALSGLEFYLHKTLRHAYRFISLMMGVSAILVALILARAAATMGLVWRVMMQQEGALDLQILYWMGLSFVAVIWVRPMFHRPKRSAIPQANEAETLTEIQPGQIGRVIYEGCSWQACCESYQGTIPPNQKVHVLHREGNLLFIAPEEFFHI